MHILVPSRSVLLLVLVASAALARDRDNAAVRTLLISEHPDTSTAHVYVKGRIVTVLRFEQPVDPTQTKMLGWEGRLEPLGVVGNKVILEPQTDLASDEGIPLVVTLSDGTEIPFLLRPPRDEGWAWADQQVNVFKNRETSEALSSALRDALKKQRHLEEEVERFRIDAALFRGKGKAAVVLTVKNLSAERAWSVQRVRLTTMATGHERAAALRATAPEFAPGTSGVVAVVLDGSAFVDEGKLTNLFLEFYRHDGLRTAFVTVDRSLLGK